MLAIRAYLIALLAICFMAAGLPLFETPARAEDERAQSSEQAKRKQRRAKRKHAQMRAKRKRAQQRAKRKRARRKRARRKRANRKRTKRTRNLPAGWAWPPNPLMRKQGQACLAELDALGVKWKRAKRKPRVATPIRVPSMYFGGIALEPTFRKGPFVMDCHLARSLAQTAPLLVAIGVSKLRFSSIHSYRRAKTNGKRKKSLSRHAYGLAVDVFEFVSTEGKTLVVAEDYQEPLLQAIEREGNASQKFRLLLTPGNDPKSHHDHFHFESKI